MKQTQPQESVAGLDLLAAVGGFRRWIWGQFGLSQSNAFHLPGWPAAARKKTFGKPFPVLPLPEAIGSVTVD